MIGKYSIHSPRSVEQMARIMALLAEQGPMRLRDLEEKTGGWSAGYVTRTMKHQGKIRCEVVHMAGSQARITWVMLPGQKLPDDASAPTGMMQKRIDSMVLYLHGHAKRAAPLHAVAKHLQITHSQAVTTVRKAEEMHLVEMRRVQEFDGGHKRNFVFLPGEKVEVVKAKSSDTQYHWAEVLRQQAANAGAARRQRVAELAAEVAALPDDPLYPMGKRPVMAWA